MDTEDYALRERLYGTIDERIEYVETEINKV